MYPTRPASPADFPRLQEIEVLAGAAFREVGLPEIADDDPPPLGLLAEFTAAGRAWVAEVDGAVAGYLLAEVVDGRVHVAQVSVDPAFRGRGIGAALVDHVDDGGGVTLTTFRDVPWNAPLYRRLGFVEIEPTGELAAVVAHEATLGLDPAKRVCMLRPAR
ncbi:GNAT family N-acetyltransferase [Actinokineospora pegani]|uniref:GNAT family N-acetyltransferase n=1 Tax=Actinokineospora pegani TaxID=2654637 RepID=UPI0012EAD435|nr:GNAT family N-acetyltransferase [Actinokineospora pegani]